MFNRKRNVVELELKQESGSRGAHKYAVSQLSAYIVTFDFTSTFTVGLVSSSVTRITLQVVMDLYKISLIDSLSHI